MDSKIFDNTILHYHSLHFWTDLFKDRSIVIIENKGMYVCLLKNETNKTIEYFCPRLSIISPTFRNSIEHKYSDYTLTKNIHKYQTPDRNTSYKHCILRCFYFLQDVDHDYYQLMTHLVKQTKLGFDELIEKLVV